MAERSAHITQTNPHKNLPSVFDAIATDNLNTYEATKRLFDVLCKDNRLIWLKKHFTEIYFGCSALIQNYYLKNYGSSLAESFYGLTRKNNTTNRFSRRDYYLSLLTLVLLPFLCEKFKNFKGNLLLSIDESDKPRQLKYKSFLRFCDNISVFVETIKLLNFLRFFSRKTQTCLLIHELCNIRLEYAESTHAQFKIQDILNNSVSFTKVISDLFFQFVGVSAFFIQFLQSFQNELKYSRIENLESPDICRTVALERNTCPICFQLIHLATVIQVSGIVYCFKCISLHFQNKGYYCPVSFYPASVEDLITLYETNN